MTDGYVGNGGPLVDGIACGAVKRQMVGGDWVCRLPNGHGGDVHHDTRMAETWPITDSGEPTFEDEPER